MATALAPRTLPLPRAAKDETAAAIYDDGILEVRVELVRPVPIGPHRTRPGRPLTAAGGRTFGLTDMTFGRTVPPRSRPWLGYQQGA